MIRFSLVVLFAAAFARGVPQGIPIQYMDSRGRECSSTRISIETGRGSYSRRITETPIGATEGSCGPSGGCRVYPGITGGLSTFQNDLELEGYAIEVWEIQGGTASDIRNDLQAEYASGSLVGAMAIGDIPTGWMDNGYGEYPIDMYLMDMNGSWTDSNSDGLFESYSNGARRSGWAG